MLYKTLKHKTLVNTFGVMVDGYDESPENKAEIGHSQVPQLRPYTATKEGLVELLSPDPKNEVIIKQLEDYYMATVSIMIFID